MYQFPHWFKASINFLLSLNTIGHCTGAMTQTIKIWKWLNLKVAFFILFCCLHYILPLRIEGNGNGQWAKQKFGLVILSQSQVIKYKSYKSYRSLDFTLTPINQMFQLKPVSEMRNEELMSFKLKWSFHIIRIKLKHDSHSYFSVWKKSRLSHRLDSRPPVQ